MPLLCVAPESYAATHTWSGAGNTAFWSNPANWQSSDLPTNGEIGILLIFPSGASRLVCTNDFTNLNVLQLSLTGSNYTLAGTNNIVLSSFSGSAINSSGGSNTILFPMTFPMTNVLRVLTNSVLRITGKISGAGGFSASGGGLLVLAPIGSVNNDFQGAATITDGTLDLESSYLTDPVFGSRTYAVAVPGPVMVGASNGTSTAILGGRTLGSNSVVTIFGNGRFNPAGDSCANLSGSGFIDFQGNSLVVGGDNSSSVFSGIMNGTNDGGIQKIGTGTLKLTGHDIGGVFIAIDEGTLILDGNFSNSSVVVGGPLNNLTGGVLKGSGSINQLVAYGPVIPGDDGPGRLTTVLNDLDFNSSLFIYMAGTNAGTGYSQIVSSSSTTLDGPTTLHLIMTNGFAGDAGDKYTILRNDGSNAIFGTFKGLPEGGTVLASNGAVFNISYAGGDGNDAVLTQISRPPAPNIGSIQWIAGGSVQLNATGFPGANYQLESTTQLPSTNWLTLATLSADTNGIVTYLDKSATNQQARFYRLKVNF